MVSQGEAFCPGHVTAFFEVCENPDPRKKGSRGAGLSLSLGVTTMARVRETSKRSLQVLVNGRATKAEVTEAAARNVLGNRSYEVKILSETPLPVAQGFGVSAAAALSTTLALDDALGLGLRREELVSLAHVTEVECGTGLGDVVPASLGGMDLRLQPGAPGHADVRRFEVHKNLLLVIVGPQLLTKSVIRNSEKVMAINRQGRACVREFETNPAFERLFDLGNRFAERTGLASRSILEAVRASRMFGRATMAMLGNSIFAEAGREELGALYMKYGTMMRCEVDNEGARVI
jgi:pantoate kinase